MSKSEWATIWVRCPKCGAKPHHPCVTAGRKQESGLSHMERTKAARKKFT